MPPSRSVSECLAERRWSIADLVAASGLDRHVVEAVAAGRYTPSPQQRRAIATALDVGPDEIAWGHTAPVQHIQGHGPQFGRSP
jgi:lambda repressor-like predicted transcriptional regulator